MAESGGCLQVSANELSGARVLVSGASGFLGGHLCRQLAAAGSELHGVSRRELESGAGVRWWRGDLTDREFTRRTVLEVKPDVVFHLASLVGGARSLDMVLPTFDANLAAAVNLLVACAEVGVQRIVLAGSMEESEAGEGHDPPSSPYAAAKGAATAYARMFHALYGTPVVVARVFMVYGPAQADLKKLVPYVTLKLLAGESPELASGTRPVDWVYVEDVAEGLVRLAATPGIDGQTLDLGSGSLVTVREVVERLGALVGAGVEARFGAVPDRALEQVRTARVAETEAKTGWRPRVGLDEGLRRTVAWYRQHGTQGKGQGS